MGIKTLKKIFIRDLKEKGQVESTFLVTRKDSGMSKSGKPYLNLKFMDRTGELEARVWEDAKEISKIFNKDDVVYVKGFVIDYQGGLQINVTNIRSLSEEEFSLRDYLPSSKRDPEEMINELEGIISAIEDKHLKRLLRDFFKDPDVRKRFMLAPAAKTMHHPYLGGLLEHVLSMCGLIERIRGHYKDIFWDLVTVGAILHDLGKIYELTYERSFDYTDEGRLLGHITIEMGMIDERIKKIPGFPEKLALLLKHMILSHHGMLEFGSPKRPKTPEALVLSFLDDLDAKVTAMQMLIKEKTGADPNWTPFNKLFDRFIYKSGKYEPVKIGKEEKDGDQKEELELFGKS
jgi:3'-5' exoribonuclease